MSRLLTNGSDSTEYLDPTHEENPDPVSLAPRLSGLEGAVIGMISNGKHGTVPLFDEIERLLIEQGAGTVVRRTKGNYSAPAEPEIVQEIHSWDAVLAGVGD